MQEEEEGNNINTPFFVKTTFFVKTALKTTPFV